MIDDLWPLETTCSESIFGPDIASWAVKHNLGPIRMDEVFWMMNRPQQDVSAPVPKEEDKDPMFCAWFAMRQAGIDQTRAFSDDPARDYEIKDKIFGGPYNVPIPMPPELTDEARETFRSSEQASKKAKGVKKGKPKQASKKTCNKEEEHDSDYVP